MNDNDHACQNLFIHWVGWEIIFMSLFVKEILELEKTTFLLK